MNAREHRDQDARGQREPRFVHICASQNDLFGLDEAGMVYQYNFNAKTWQRLASGRSQETPEQGRRAQRGDTPSESPRQTGETES
jgi:hypothetical protein